MGSNQGDTIRRAKSFESLTSSLRQGSSSLRRFSKALRPNHAIHANSSPGRLHAIQESNDSQAAARAASHELPRINTGGQHQHQRHPSSPLQRGTGRDASNSPVSDNEAIPSLEDTSKVFHVHCARRLISSVVKSVSSLEDTIRQLGYGHVHSAQVYGPRITHVRKILQVQDKRLSTATGGLDRLRFICACLSLAHEFELFRRREVYKHKDSKFTEDLPSSDDKSASEDELYAGFVKMQVPVTEDERVSLDTAVRFGTKLRVTDAIGKSMHLGSGFALLCAYEYFKLVELPHRAFPTLRLELEQSWAACNGIRNFSSSIEHWWKDYFQDYEWHYGSTKELKRRASPPSPPMKHSRSASATTSATMPAPLQPTRPSIQSSVTGPYVHRTTASTSTVTLPHSASTGSLPQKAIRSTASKKALALLGSPLEEKDEMISPRLLSRIEKSAPTQPSHEVTNEESSVSIRPRPRPNILSTAETSLKRRSRSMDDLRINIAHASATSSRQRRPSAQIPDVPRRSSRRPTIDTLMPAQATVSSPHVRWKGHKHSHSVDRVEFERPKLARSNAVDDIGLRTTATVRNANQYPKSSTEERTIRKKPSRPYIDTNIPPPVPAKDTVSPPRKPSASKSSTSKSPSPKSSSPKTPSPKSPSSASAENHIASQSIADKPLPTLLTSKYYRHSERPTPGSVEVHLDDLLQGLEEQLTTERAALPILQDAVPKSPVTLRSPVTACSAGG